MEKTSFIKKSFSVVVALVLIFLFASCKKAAGEAANISVSPVPAETQSAAAEPSAAPAAEIPNPVVEVDGSADFSNLGFVITPYQGSEDIHYSIIGGTLEQIVFTLDGETYTYRAAETTDDIAGVYETFDEPQSLDLEGPNFTLSVNIRTIGGGASGALALWELDGVRYSLYTPDPTDYEEMTDVLLPILYTDLPFAACCG